ncbi:MAG: WXG100 family type VII secretion target [Leucobacter sp.]
MESMSVQTALVTALAAEIRTGSKNIRLEIEGLETEVTKLRGAWSGDSQAAYDQAQHKWTQSIGQMQMLLERIAGSTEQIAQSYNASDGRGSKRFTAQ